MDGWKAPSLMRLSRSARCSARSCCSAWTRSRSSASSCYLRCSHSSGCGPSGCVVGDGIGAGGDGSSVRQSVMIVVLIVEPLFTLDVSVGETGIVYTSEFSEELLDDIT